MPWQSIDLEGKYFFFNCFIFRALRFTTVLISCNEVLIDGLKGHAAQFGLEPCKKRLRH